MKPTIETIIKHVEAVSPEARKDMAAGCWDEVMTDTLYTAVCGAEMTAAEMAEARSIAEAAAKRLVRKMKMNSNQIKSRNSPSCP